MNTGSFCIEWQCAERCCRRQSSRCHPPTFAFCLVQQRQRQDQQAIMGLRQANAKQCHNTSVLLLACLLTCLPACITSYAPACLLHFFDDAYSWTRTCSNSKLSCRQPAKVTLKQQAPPAPPPAAATQSLQAAAATRDTLQMTAKSGGRGPSRAMQAVCRMRNKGKSATVG